MVKSALIEHLNRHRVKGKDMGIDVTKPDYEMDALMELTTPEEYRALGDSLRQKILGLLSERAATTTELATLLNCPTSTMAHHINVLVQARLARVVRTRRVRAVTERYYGRVARRYIGVSETVSDGDQLGRQRWQQVLAEIVSSEEDGWSPAYMFGYARIPAAQAQVFAERMRHLVDEFSNTLISGAPTYGCAALVYQTDWPEVTNVKE